MVNKLKITVIFNKFNKNKFNKNIDNRILFKK